MSTYKTIATEPEIKIDLRLIQKQISEDHMPKEALLHTKQGLTLIERKLQLEEGSLQTKTAEDVIALNREHNTEYIIYIMNILTLHTKALFGSTHKQNYNDATRRSHPFIELAFQILKKIETIPEIKSKISDKDKFATEKTRTENHSALKKITLD